MTSRVQSIRIATGLIVWIAVLAALIGTIRLRSNEQSNRATKSLVTYSTQSRQLASLQFEDQIWIGMGDAIFLQNGDDYTRIGEVNEIFLDYETEDRRLGE